MKSSRVPRVKKHRKSRRGAKGKPLQRDPKKKKKFRAKTGRARGIEGERWERGRKISGGEGGELWQVFSVGADSNRDGKTLRDKEGGEVLRGG